MISVYVSTLITRYFLFRPRLPLFCSGGLPLMQVSSLVSLSSPPWPAHVVPAPLCPPQNKKCSFIPLFILYSRPSFFATIHDFYTSCHHPNLALDRSSVLTGFCVSVHYISAHWHSLHCTLNRRLVIVTTKSHNQFRFPPICFHLWPTQLFFVNSNYSAYVFCHFYTSIYIWDHYWKQLIYFQFHPFVCQFQRLWKVIEDVSFQIKSFPNYWSFNFGYCCLRFIALSIRSW